MLYQNFKKHIEVNDFLSAGDTVIAAVSGGLDSVVLLHLLKRISKEFSLNIHVAHFDHETRAGASKSDAIFVEEFA